MAETMTYDAGTDTITTSETLNPDEQESLKVGEEMEQQQDNLLAGKYKNAQELEKAYAELEKKLGDQSNETESKAEEVEEEAPTEIPENHTIISEASNEFFENGELTEETMNKFANMSSKDLVQAYMEMSKANPQEPTSPIASDVDLTDAEVNSIKNSVGGEAQYANMVQWATNNLPKNTIEAFDSLINSGNAGAIQLAVNGLRQQYETSNGYEGRQLQGKPSTSSGDVFRSQPELVAAMNDPRYDRDPAYRIDVMEKLERSDINF
jgi:hypothetical protein